MQFKLKNLPTFQEISKWLRYNEDTGEIFWINRPCPNVFAGDIAGTKTKNGYKQISFQKRVYKAHRIAWLLYYGVWPASFIDHINGDRMDNRIRNLRQADSLINSQNQRKAMKRNSTGFLGVSPCNGRWKAEISSLGKKKYLGTFDSPELAYAAYIEEKRKLHIGCTL